VGAVVARGRVLRVGKCGRGDVGERRAWGGEAVGGGSWEAAWLCG